MSGAELAIGVVALAITVADHYEAVSKAISRYRKTLPNVMELQLSLKTQRTVFRVELTLLITQITGYDVAQKMVGDRDDMRWHDKTFNEDLDRYLDDRRDATAGTMKSIEDELKTLEDDLQQLHNVITDSDSVKPSDGVRRRCGKVSSKLKFSLRQDRDWRKRIANLKDLNNDLRILTAQAKEISQQLKPNQRNILAAQAPRNDRDVQRFRIVQRAAGHLYDALRNACTKHTEHQTHFCLQPVLDDKGKSQVRFTIGLKSYHHNNNSCSTGKQPAWLVIESVISDCDDRSVGSAAITPAVSTVPAFCPRTDVNKSGKTPAAACPTPPEPKRRRVRFASSSAAVNPRLLVQQAVAANQVPLPNLCENGNFCNRLGIYYSTGDTTKCLGLLETTCGPCRHLVYAKTPDSMLPRQQGELEQATSLSSLITLMPNQRRNGGLLHHERIRLAKLLATAVLQFHGTPWLKDTWRSGDVFFFGLEDGIGSSKAIKTLTAPYTTVAVRDAATVQNADCAALVRNPLLFGLGVMLLELAFESPLKSIKTHSRRQANGNATDTPNAELLMAKNACEIISAEMGLPYKNIVKKCLQCDFGHGEDLHDPGLQARFYQDVICELDRLERKFKELQLGD